MHFIDSSGRPYDLEILPGPARDLAHEMYQIIALRRIPSAWVFREYFEDDVGRVKGTMYLARDLATIGLVYTGILGILEERKNKREKIEDITDLFKDLSFC